MIRALLFSLAFAACATEVRAGPLEDALQRFDGCWTGVFAGQEGLRDSRCFTRLNFGAQWKDAHTVEGTGYGGVTIYAWDAELGCIDVMYYASDRGFMRGYAIPDADGLVIPDARYVGPDGTAQHLRSRWRMLSEDRFEIVSEQEVDGEWRALMRITYARPTE